MSYKRIHDGPFIGVDGEGVTRENGQHDYILLSVGDRSLHDAGERLTTHQIFNFLWRQRVMNPQATFVGFYLGYDFSQWLRDISEDAAFMLLSERGITLRKPRNSKNPVPYPVRWEGWEFDMLGMRRFKLRPDNKTDAPWMFICDTGPFWQSSFLSAMNPAKWPHPVCTPDEYKTLREGKARRSTADFDREMIRYNVLENKMLARATRVLRDGFHANGWDLKREQWHGPGQAVNKWLRQISAPTGAAVRDQTPPPVLQAALASYYGGWFEIFEHGHVGDAYEYDLNSAYPYIMSTLPCLLHGEWHHNTPSDRDTLELMHVRVIGRSSKIGPLPYRLADGRIRRTRHVTGWYWKHELQASVNAGLVESYEILESWSYQSYCADEPPLSSIANLYKQRLAVGKNSPQGRGNRLVYNSGYGKLAQSIGSPTYANPIYASLITSGCRTMILDAIATHPNGQRDLLMVATDGVYFRTPHPGLTISDSQLGAWGQTRKQALTLFMPGIYWDQNVRDALARGAIAPIKSRGVNAAALTPHIAAADRAWTAMAAKPSSLWPTINIPIPFTLTSPRQALARGKWETCGAVDTSATRRLDSNPQNKRSPKPVIRDGRIMTRLHEGVPGAESAPYDRTMGLTVRELLDNTPFYGLDMDDLTELNELLKGDM